jgi:cytochrome b pre-mRNA-processing protein 3
MLKRIFNRKPFAKEAARLYETIVRQSRDPWFYAELGVPDNVDGRFDMIVLHAWLVFRRLRELDQFDLSQALFDEMFADMDENLRRLGVGDMSVGKNVKRMAEALYGRMNAYDEGVLAGDRELITVIQRNLYGTVENPNGAWLAAMASYIRRQMKSTSSVSSTELKEGNAGYLPTGGEGS